jgi:hypothetical protein
MKYVEVDYLLVHNKKRWLWIQIQS